jgi:hypothetical protein
MAVMSLLWTIDRRNGYRLTINSRCGRSENDHSGHGDRFSVKSGSRTINGGCQY